MVYNVVHNGFMWSVSMTLGDLLNKMEGCRPDVPVFVYDSDRAYSLPLVGVEFDGKKLILIGETP